MREAQNRTYELSIGIDRLAANETDATARICPASLPQWRRWVATPDSIRQRFSAHSVGGAALAYGGLADPTDDTFRQFAAEVVAAVPSFLFFVALDSDLPKAVIAASLPDAVVIASGDSIRVRADADVMREALRRHLSAAEEIHELLKVPEATRLKRLAALDRYLSTE